VPAAVQTGQWKRRLRIMAYSWFITGTQYGIDGHDGLLAAAQSSTLHPNSASWAFAGPLAPTARMALTVRAPTDLYMLASISTASLTPGTSRSRKFIIMTEIINGQCAVEQPQRYATQSKVVETSSNSQAVILFINGLANSPRNVSLPKPIDSLNEFGQYDTGAMRDLGSRTWI